jgi:alkanesulfonate monooxygenase SsuD/methylene tetrahydromethanopterin reductase-like flavin-dependent oxidoreductase (luciferase family)
MSTIANRPPLREGSIFAVFNLHYGLEPTAALEELRHQARLAVELGFDGVGLSEHHAGFPGYLPSPLLFGASLLAELPRGFYAALPILLPLRFVAGVVEELAWLDARFPGRVVAGFAAGYYEDDFEAFGVPFADRFPRFRRMFEQVAVELRGEGRIENQRRDPAVAQARGRIGLVMNTSGPRNAQLAGRLGAGITPVQMSVDDYRELFRTYRAAGGRGPIIVQRWVFLGDPPLGAIDKLNDTNESPTGDHGWRTNDSRIIPLDDHDPERMAERLIEHVRAIEATALCIRWHLGPLEPAVVREQIDRFGREVLPLVRQRMDTYIAELATKELATG